MSLQRLSVAVPLTDASIEPEAMVPVFHDWIRRGVVPGLLIDVARYAHVPGGPGIVLIGHEGDYALDLADGRPWLRYTLKRDNEGAPAELVVRALERLLGAVAATREAGVAVEVDEVVVRVYDRLRAPNSPETESHLGPEILNGARVALGGVPVLSVSQLTADRRDPYGVVISTSRN